MPSPDFVVSADSSMVLFHPLTDTAREWFKAHLPDDAPRMGKSYAVEANYADDIYNGAIEAGLSQS